MSYANCLFGNAALKSVAHSDGALLSVTDCSYFLCRQVHMDKDSACMREKQQSLRNAAL